MANLNEFLQDVLPESPNYIFTRKVSFYSEQQERQISGMSNVVADEKNLQYTLDRLFATNYSRDQDIYFATAGYDLPMHKVEEIRENTHGDDTVKNKAVRKFINKIRQSCYITGRKAIYIDIDRFKDELPTDGLHEGRKVYHDMSVAVKDVGRAVKSLGLPKPTYVVFSGRGLHIYWAMEEATTLEDWRYMQMQVNLMFAEQAKIDVDMSVAKNDNGVMRIPTSYNTKSKKYGELHKIGELVQRDSLALILDEAVPRKTVVFSESHAVLFGGEPVPDFIQAQMKPYNTSEWGSWDNPVPVWSDLTNPDYGCNFLRWCEGDGRMVLGNEDWSALMTVAINCEGGDQLIHTLSEGHPSYSFEDTETRARSFSGIYSCARISGIDTGKVVTEACKGCRYISKDNKTILRNPTEIMNRIPMTEEVSEDSDRPLLVVNNHPEENSGTAIETIKHEDQPLEIDVEVLSERVINLYMPDGFCILEPDRMRNFTDDGKGEGIAFKYTDTDEPSAYVLQRVTTGYIYAVDAIRDSTRNTIEYEFAVQQADNKLVHLRFSSEELASDDDLVKLFASVGVIYHLSDAKSKKGRTALFLNYIRQSVGKLMMINQRFTSNIKQFGWTPDKKGFLLGDWLIYGGERRERAHPTKSCVPYVDAMTPPPTARVHKWAEAASIYSHKGMESAQFIMGVSLASPVLGLLATADAQGALINIFSQDSGLGKTTLAHSALSIWGRAAPVGNRVGLSGISNDTQKSRIFGMSLFQNIPYYMDETTDMKPQQSYQLVYQITQGQDARRMKQSGTELHDTIGGWNMVTMTSSNKSLVEKLYTIAGASADAVHARVLEIDMAKLRSARDVADAAGNPLYTHADIQNAFRTMQFDNYAIIGQDYLIKVADKRDSLVNEFEAIRRELDSVFKFRSFERFWANTAVVGIMGIRHGNQFGYFNFDEQAVIKWLEETLRGIREVRSESKVSISDIINDYLSNQQANSIVSENGRDAKWMAGRPTPISFRHNVDTQEYQIPVRNFKEYVQESYNWTPKECERAMDALCGVARRYRFLKGLDQVPSEVGAGQITSWRVGYDLLK